MSAASCFEPASHRNARRIPALDDIAFDRLTRIFSTSRSRRTAAHAVLGTFLGYTLLGQNAGVAAESGRGSGGRKSKRKGKGRGSGKGKRNDACTRAGNTPKRGKPCCKDLRRDGSGNCAAPDAGCVPRTCADLGATCGSVSDGCGGMLDCGCAIGEVCCDGACVTGVCCVNRDCGPSGNTCTDHECFCGTGPRCMDATPTCCLPGDCTNTLTDQINCGECGFPCEGNETCCNGACVDTKSDDVWNCGGCGIQCVIGETCDQGVCRCGVNAGPCREDEFCNGTGVRSVHRRQRVRRHVPEVPRSPRLRYRSTQSRSLLFRRLRRSSYILQLQRPMLRRQMLL